MGLLEFTWQSRHAGFGILIQTNVNSGRESALTDLATSVCNLENFVRGYQWIDDPSLDTDDEILNWVFAEMPTDFSSAIWLLASGFYKASASSLRNALDISTASLYFRLGRTPIRQLEITIVSFVAVSSHQEQLPSLQCFGK